MYNPEIHPKYPHVSQTELFRYGEMLTGNEMFRWGQSRGGWGSGKTFAQGELVGSKVNPIGLLDIPSPTIARVPRVQNVTLIANPTFTGAFAGILRWRIEAGVGTARSTIICDASRLQQVSLSAESLRVSLFLDDYGDTPANGENLIVEAAAYGSDGNTSTSPAVFTMPWFTNPGAEIQVLVPEAATTWTVQGISVDVNRATMRYRAVQESGLTIDSFTGDQLLSAHASGAFLTLQGGAESIAVANNELVDQISGSIVFQLDI